jgi:hypothetical protein
VFFVIEAGAHEPGSIRAISQGFDLADVRYPTLERKTVESINGQEGEKLYTGLELPIDFVKESVLLFFGSFEGGWIG